MKVGLRLCEVIQLSINLALHEMTPRLLAAIRSRRPIDEQCLTEQTTDRMISEGPVQSSKLVLPCFLVIFSSVKMSGHFIAYVAGAVMGFAKRLLEKLKSVDVQVECFFKPLFC